MIPKVSVLIPVYNVEKYIARCVDSVLSQTMQDFEIIAVDDCGKDGSIKILQDYAQKDLRIKILYHPENLGLMMARRTAYEAATGKYIVFLDSDDYLPVNALEILYKKITESEANIVSAEYQLVTDDNILEKHSSNVEGLLSSRNVIELLIKNKIPHSLCGKIYDHSLFNDSSTIPVYKNQVLAEDMMLYYTLVSKSNYILFCNDIVYNYYLNLDSSTKTKYNRSKFEMLIRAYNYKHELLNKMYSELLHEEYWTTALEIICVNLRRGIPNDLLAQIPKEWLDRFTYKYLKKRYGITKACIYSAMKKSSFVRSLINSIL